MYYFGLQHSDTATLEIKTGPDYYTTTAAVIISLLEISFDIYT